MGFLYQSCYPLLYLETHMNADTSVMQGFFTHLVGNAQSCRKKNVNQMNFIHDPL